MSAKIADLILMRFAHIEHKKILAGIQAALEFFHLHLGNRCFHGLLLTTNSAKLVVVYQFCNGGMSATGRAVRIFAQLEFAELHAQRVNQKKAPDKRLAYTENQLDDFG